ncbi:hypothetical protein FISHEDRAFT_56567 [Fistulina hepatica ATCC 64428]|uniref:Uncharacterized protein n=1 Tax=Fistulina hepatica ATCC 64428 TaxID=1128425 RepID=A0A0D7AIG8_9AGAR|nr:hypothetical protein FISHEDRAFT_56567 [Fistulina hepatica ATCC 64428]
MIPKRVKAPPKIHYIQVKTHKFAVMLSFPPSTPLSSLKREVCDAFSSPLASSGIPDDPLPANVSVDDFLFCSRTKVKNELVYVDLEDERKTFKDLGFTAWETLFVKFKDSESGEWLPINVDLPPLEDTQEEDASGFKDGLLPLPADIDMPGPSMSTRAGKRKARDDD